MRFVLAAMAATLIIGVGTPTISFAQKKQQVTRASVNECIRLARQRGWTDSDLDTGGGKANPARNFVIRCLQGKQR